MVLKVFRPELDKLRNSSPDKFADLTKILGLWSTKHITLFTIITAQRTFWSYSWYLWSRSKIVQARSVIVFLNFSDCSLRSYSFLRSCFISSFFFDKSSFSLWYVFLSFFASSLTRKKASTFYISDWIARRSRRSICFRCKSSGGATVCLSLFRSSISFLFCCSSKDLYLSNKASYSSFSSL